MKFRVKALEKSKKRKLELNEYLDTLPKEIGYIDFIDKMIEYGTGERSTRDLMTLAREHGISVYRTVYGVYENKLVN